MFQADETMQNRQEAKTGQHLLFNEAGPKLAAPIENLSQESNNTMATTDLA